MDPRVVDLEGRSVRSDLRYEPTGSKTTIAGQEFEIGLCCLLLVRCQRLCEEFFLACNHGEAGLFDDVVLVYRRIGSPVHKAMLVQMKHKEKREIKLWTKSTRPKATTSTKPASELAEYCRSYAMVRDKWRCVQEDECQAAEGRLPPVKEAIYIFFTNTRVQLDEAGREMVSPPNDTDDLWDLLMVGGVAFRIDGDSLDVPTVWGATVPDVAPEFLNDLMLCCDQADHKGMAKHLDLELRRTLGSTFVASQLWDAVKEWWEQKGSVSYLTKDSAIWEAVVHAQRTRLNALTPDDISLTFSDESKMELISFLVTAGDVVHLKLRDDSEVTMAWMRLRHTIQTALILDSAVLGGHVEEVTAVLKTPFCNVVAVTFTGYNEELLKQLLTVVRSLKGKCLVVASTIDVVEDTSEWSEWLWTPIWKHLHHVSRERLLSKPVLLQGTPLSLRDVVSPDVIIASEVLSDQHVHEISSQNSVIVLGNAVPNPLPYYVTRNLQREVLGDQTFINSLRERDVIVGVTGVTDEELEKVFGEEFIMTSIEELWARSVLSSATLVTSKWESSVTDVRDLCFKFGCDGFFITTTNAKMLISRESSSFHMTEVVSKVLHTRSKKVVVYGDPGIGKSSLVTCLCQESKREYSQCWILRVDMGKQSDFINSRDFFVSVDAEELLLLQVAPGLQRDLVRHALKETGDIFVFVDAFDEISPTYTLKCCKFLKIVATEFRYRKLVVTTRPVTRNEVEAALEVNAFHLPEFSKEEQRTFLRSFYTWKGKSLTDAEVEALLSAVGPVLQVPLLCYMASEVTLASLPGGVDVQSKAVLYEEFLERQIRIYLLDKYGLRSSVSHVEELLETCKRGLRAQLTALAVTTMLSVEERAAVVFSDGGDPPPSDSKLGLVVGGQFVHRTFAEFFLGVWLAEHYRTCPPETLETILFRDNSELITESFNRFLYRGCRLHGAVAAGDVSAVEALLDQDSSMALLVDAGGRTALHVAALSAHGNPELWTELLDSRIDSAKVESVFGWSVARCAERVGNWALVEFLASHDLCDVRDLDAVKDVSTARQILRNSVSQGYEDISLQILTMHPTLLHETFDEWPCGQVLHHASESGCERLVAELLRRGADVDVLTGTGFTALYMAALKGHAGVVKLLVDAGASLTKGLRTALTAAARMGKVDIVDFLIDKGADVHLRNKMGETVLHVAALEADVATLVTLLQHGGIADARDNEGTSPLHNASRCATPDKASLLLDHGADVNALNDLGLTPLYQAAAEGRVEVVQLLLSHGAQVNLGKNPLNAACVADWPIVVERLLDAGADTKMALYYSGAKCIHVVAKLLERGVDANSRGELGQTGLIRASSLDNLEAMSLFLRHGADVNLADNFGMTPLHWAAQEGRLNAASMLLKAGANVGIRDRNGSTALHLAVSNAMRHIVQSLLDHGADVNAKDASGRTALHRAAKEGTTAIVELLLDHGASIDCEDVSGKTAIQLAGEEGRQGTVALLLERGSSPRGSHRIIPNSDIVS